MKFKKNDESNNNRRSTRNEQLSGGDILNFTTTPAQKNSIVRE